LIDGRVKGKLMKAIILAAGRGSRMKAETEERPKCMVELAGRSLLNWQLDSLKGAGVEKIAVVTGYLAERFSIPGITYFNNPRWEETNMVVSLVSASEWLREDACLISYADIVYPVDTAARLCEVPGNIVITYDLDWLKLWEARFEDPLADAETFRVDDSGRLIEIGGRADRVEEIEGQYMGLFKITPSGWRIIESHLACLTDEERDRMDVTSMLGGLIKSGVEIDTVPINGRWFEVDSESDLDLYRSISGESGGLW